ncbi:MAG TPA: HNH endonuclease [Clostridiaceae bacterium]
MNGTCELCGKENIYCEIHHRIFKSQAVYMRTIKANLAKLCVECHRGNGGVHLNKEADLKLKTNLQHKLTEMFSEKTHYCKDEIREILDCSDFDAVLICKRLCGHRDGYRVDEILIRLMGGRNYI